jgi:hypothetical protein
VTGEEAVAEYLRLGQEARVIRERSRQRRAFARSIVTQLADAGLIDLAVPAPPKIDTPYMNVEEAAAYCRLSVQTLYNARRELESVEGTRRLLFTREMLDAWLVRRRQH